MDSTLDDRLLDVLDDVVAALERGDWRTAWTGLARGDLSSVRQELVDLAICLRCVTRSMRFQCAAGDVASAAGQLDTAARRLRVNDNPLLLGPEPSPDWRERHLSWATIRLVLREKADLDAVRQTFEVVRRGQQELVHACVQHLIWVKFDPWTVRVHPDDQALLGVDGAAYERFRTINRHDICDRATRLRQFADVRDGTATVKTWPRSGGYGAFFEAALLELATEPISYGPRGVPIRRGRVRAWEYAYQLSLDAYG